MRVSPEDEGQAIDERTSLEPSLPPTSYSQLRHAVLNFRENIQRPQLEMKFSIKDLSTQIFPLTSQFPDNFLLRTATTRLICVAILQSPHLFTQRRRTKDCCRFALFLTHWRIHLWQNFVAAICHHLPLDLEFQHFRCSVAFDALMTTFITSLSFSHSPLSFHLLPLLPCTSLEAMDRAAPWAQLKKERLPLLDIEPN